MPSATTLEAQDQSCEVLELSIVMPCLNEAETIETCIRKAFSALRTAGATGEVVVADNGSTDGSQQIATRMGARLVEVPQKGYGAALSAGIEAARGKFVVMADADDSYDFSEISRFLQPLRAGADLVIGNRFKGGIKPQAMPFLHRYLGNPVLSFVGRLFFGSDVGDFHCGMRGFSKAAFQRMELRTTGMEFASEMVVKVSLKKMRVAEVPVTLSPDGRSRPPHLRTWRDGWRHLRFLLLYSPRWLFLYPGTALMLIGMAVTAWLLPGTRTLGHLHFDVHTLLFSNACVMLGIQVVLFGVFAKVYAIQEGFLPADVNTERLLQHFTVEGGVLTGLLLLAGGLALSIVSLAQWRAAGFGPLDVHVTLRIVAPAVLAMTAGAELVMASFFLAVLTIRHR